MRINFFSFLVTLFIVTNFASCASGGKSTPSLAQPSDAFAVDLGLPSGTKWANMNIGASSPYDAGSYFQWGETVECNDTTEDVYIFKNYTPGNTAFTGTEDSDMGKECDPMFADGVIQWDEFSFTYGDIAGNVKYDAATANWGEEWGTPTLDQIRELLICCDWTPKIIDDMMVYKVVGPSGDSIFLPGASYRGANVEKDDSRSATYWSSTLGPNKGIDAHLFHCQPDGSHYNRLAPRLLGCNVRPVTAGHNRMKEATPEAVDLALPSGTKWANMNVGACSPEEWGDYFQWGETTPCTNIREHLSMIINYTPGFIPVRRDNFGTEKDPMYADGYTDERGLWRCNIAGKTKYDAATANWGQQWRMPTKAQMEELVNECQWTMCSLNGVNGARILGKNGNSIFLPAAGSRSEDDLYFEGRYGHYWSGDGFSKYDSYSIDFFVERGKSRDTGTRREGYSVRPVLAGTQAGPAQDSTIAADQTVTKGIGAVDLGLPSGTKWANANIGASTPDAPGEYFAWGEINAKNNYDVQSYAHFRDGTLQNIGDNIAGTEYDVAFMKWGGKWRMPTARQFEELTTECTWDWEERDDSYGYKVTGPNGNHIFLPAVGNRCGTDLPGNDMESYGNYWTATANGIGNSWSCSFTEGAAPRIEKNGYRPYGLSVRPVTR